MRYRPDKPLVLKKISLTIKGGEKVGIVGRTGSGKSTIMVVLFRLVETCGGSIEIDGVNIKSIGLDELRSKLTIIPQEPFMFNATVRQNLDPFKKYSDNEIWEALEKVGLKPFVSELQGGQGLTATVSEYGENFSVGQRQLICLARALLRRSQIILLDEATSSVDFETDKLIQTTIRKDFSHCTILTIAHRLNTIIDCDKILTLDEGLVSEYDNPASLLRNEDGVFAKLVEELGPAAKANLFQIAEEIEKSKGTTSTLQVQLKVDETPISQSSGGMSVNI